MLFAAAWPCCAATVEIPAGTLLEVRLLETFTSSTAAIGGPVHAVVVAPVSVDGAIRIPQGATLSGVIDGIRQTGWGFRRETARVSFKWDRLTLPGGEHTIEARTVMLDNARETVDDEGHIRGIRSTGTIGYRTSNLIAGVATFDPIAYLFVNVAAARMLRFAVPEIVLPRGAEMFVLLEEPLTVEAAFAPLVGPVARTPDEAESLHRLVRGLPFRAFKPGMVPSDLVNIVLLGSGPAMRRAFRAAGWVEADQFSASSAFLTFRSIAENQGYQAAPMTTLLLDERPPGHELSKTLNTFARRHHVRFWSRLGDWNGLEVLAGAATHDTGIIFSRRNRSFTHSIDPWIDDERTKIVNDLLFTGCVAAYERVPRDWLPASAREVDDHTLHTDGAVAVLLLNSCDEPERYFAAIEPESVPLPAGRWQRGVRQGVLIARNDVLRANLVWQAWEGTRWLSRQLRKPAPPDRIERTSAEPAASLLWQDGDPAPPEAEPGPHGPTRRNDGGRWAPNLFELGVQGGRLRYGLPRLDPHLITFTPLTPDGAPFTLATSSDLGSGWAASIVLTMNSYRYFSQDLAFSYQRGKYDLFVNPVGAVSPNPGVETERAGLLTRQFQYTWLAHATPRERRFRPYLAAGPAFQLVHLTNAPLERAGGIFRVGLRNIGLIKSAYNFRRDPPLDGGGIFQVALQYGGGVKWRAHPRWVVRGDFRETLAPQPDFISSSFLGKAPGAPEGYATGVVRGGTRSVLRQQRLTVGFAFTF